MVSIPHTLIQQYINRENCVFKLSSCTFIFRIDQVQFSNLEQFWHNHCAGIFLSVWDAGFLH